jgi:hypothetical protein
MSSIDASCLRPALEAKEAPSSALSGMAFARVAPGARPSVLRPLCVAGAGLCLFGEARALTAHLAD